MADVFKREGISSSANNNEGRMALKQSEKLATGKKETWGSAFANAAFLNVPALIRANRGEKPQVITVRNAVADVGVHSVYLFTLGTGPLLVSMMMGGASLARYQQKKIAGKTA